MSWGKKSGGVISVYYLLLLSMCAGTLAAGNVQMRQAMEMMRERKENRMILLAYIEMLYYIRNELYDETYRSLTYASDSVMVNIQFQKKDSGVLLYFQGAKQLRQHRILYDVSCRCITDIEENTEKKQYNYRFLDD